jgi:aryl carrier-like protein
LLEQQLLDGEFAADLAEVAKHSGGAGTRAATASPDSIESRLLAICNGVLTGRAISAQDNLFEIGASSLKLIEIHEQIDREYPNLVDLTELFDHPTVAQLAKHLASKIDQPA